MKKTMKYIIISMLFITLSLGSGFYFMLKNLNKPSNPSSTGDLSDVVDEYLKGGRKNILLLGLDAGTIGAPDEYNRYRSDTMIVMSIDAKRKDIKVLSLPRDTRVNLSGFGVEKINAATAFGGPSLAVKTVKDFLGVPIHDYVVVNLNGFKEIIDVLGGVEMTLEKRLKYDDFAGNFHIDLQPGHQILYGNEAEQLVRFRKYPEGDVERVRVQQQFMAELTKTVLKPSTILKLPKIIETVQANIDTSLEPLEMLGMANLARQLKTDDVTMYMLPGEGKYISGVSYFIPENSKMYKMVEEIFFDDGILKVAVLNGTGTSGLAGKVAEKLKSQGYNVVEVSNADSFDYENTTILYPKEQKADAEKLARLFDKAQIKEEDEGKLTTVIVGKDTN